MNIKTFKNGEMYNEDCFYILEKMQYKSIDLILVDLPYGQTSLKWDKPISLTGLWRYFYRIIKDTSSIIIFGKEPFSSRVRLSASELYKYDYIWIKNNSGAFMHSKNKPRSMYENIMVFSKGLIKHKSQDLTNTRMIYYPQGLKKFGKKNRRGKDGEHKYDRPSIKKDYIQEYTNYPTDILHYDVVNNPTHPAQKPMPLLQHLIKTYTKEGDTVLDCCMGSGSTCVAAQMTNRKFIGIEKEKKYFGIAKDWLEGEEE